MNEIREEMSAKLKAKKAAVEKKLSKPKNLLKQKQTFLDAIEEHKVKMAKLEELVAKIDDSLAGYEDETSLRESEVEHMEEILSRFDKGSKELVACSETMLGVITRYESTIDLSVWTPGQASPSDLAKKDPEYVKAFKRKAYLDKMLPECLTDIKRVFYSRGTVSDYNVKGRKGV